MYSNLYHTTEPVIGRVLRTNQPYEPGDLIFQEKPIFVASTIRDNNSSFKCLLYKFVDDIFENTEFQIEKDICERFVHYVLGYLELSKEKRSEIVSHFFHQSSGDGPVVLNFLKDTMSELYNEVIRQLTTNLKYSNEKIKYNCDVDNIEEFINLNDIIRLNGLSCFDNYVGLFPNFTLMKHDCKPNIHILKFNNFEVKIFALESIKPGKALTLYYSKETLINYPNFIRRQHIYRLRQFWCNCNHCDSEDLTRPLKCPKQGCDGYMYSSIERLHNNIFREWICRDCLTEYEGSEINQSNASSIVPVIGKEFKLLLQYSKLYFDLYPNGLDIKQPCSSLLEAKQKAESVKNLVGEKHWLYMMTYTSHLNGMSYSNSSEFLLSFIRSNHIFATWISNTFPNDQYRKLYAFRKIILLLSPLLSNSHTWNVYHSLNESITIVEIFHLLQTFSPSYKLKFMFEELIKQLNILIDKCCLGCGKTNLPLMKCSRCYSVSYCSKPCQQKDWKRHKTYCTVAEPNIKATVINTVIGRVLRTNQSYEPGDLIFTESPIFFIPLRRDKNSSLKISLYKFVDDIISFGVTSNFDLSSRLVDVVLGYLELSKEKRSEILNYFYFQNISDDPFNLEQLKHIITQLYNEVKSLLTTNSKYFKEKKKYHCDVENVDEFMNLHDIIRLNGSSCRDKYIGLFTYFTLMKHDCKPNIITLDEGKADLKIMAIQSIKPGDAISLYYSREILTNYPNLIRRQHINRMRQFWCHCDLCKGEDLTRPLKCPKEKCDGYMYSSMRRFQKNIRTEWICRDCLSEYEGSRYDHSNTSSLIPIIRDEFNLLLHYSQLYFELNDEDTDIKQSCSSLLEAEQNAQTIRNVVGEKHWLYMIAYTSHLNGMSDSNAFDSLISQVRTIHVFATWISNTFPNDEYRKLYAGRKIISSLSFLLSMPHAWEVYQNINESITVVEILRLLQSFTPSNKLKFIYEENIKILSDLLDKCCLGCGKISLPLMKCSRCYSVSYCSKTCQKSDWKRHKIYCTVVEPNTNAGNIFKDYK